LSTIDMGVEPKKSKKLNKEVSASWCRWDHENEISLLQ